MTKELYHSEPVTSLNNDNPPPSFVSEPVTPQPKNIYEDVPQELQKEVENSANQINRLNLSDHKARVSLILDISASMENPNKFYSTGKVKALVEKALALAYHFDDNQSVEIFPFGEKCYPPIVVNLNNFQGVTEYIVKQCGGLKSETNYADAIRNVTNYYFHNYNNQKSDLPVFSIFITDGDCNDAYKNDCLAELINSSNKPIFFKFVALKGKSMNEASFEFLQQLDNYPVIGDRASYYLKNGKRLIDNSDFVLLDNPNDLSFTHLLNEYPQYLSEAFYNHNLFTSHPGICRMTNEELSTSDRTVALSPNNSYGHFSQRYLERRDTQACPCVLI